MNDLQICKKNGIMINQTSRLYFHFNTFLIPNKKPNKNINKYTSVFYYKLINVYLRLACQDAGY